MKQNIIANKTLSQQKYASKLRKNVGRINKLSTKSLWCIVAPLPCENGVYGFQTEIVWVNPGYFSFLFIIIITSLFKLSHGNLGQLLNPYIEVNRFDTYVKL